MIKAVATDPKTGRSLVVLGLSQRNLDKFRAAPLDSMIQIDGRALGIDVDIVLFSGPTEAAMAEVLRDMIGPDTKINVDPKLQS